MENKEIDALVEMVFFPKTHEDKSRALLHLARRDLYALRLVIHGAVRYLRAVANGRLGASLQMLGPWNQLARAYDPVQSLLIYWNQRPVLEELTKLLDDPDRNIRALAAVQLGVSSLQWLENPSAPAIIRKRLQEQGTDQIVRNQISKLQRNSDPVVRVAAEFAAGYVALNDLTSHNLPLDPAIQQKMEQYAGQLISSIARR